MKTSIRFTLVAMVAATSVSCSKQSEPLVCLPQLDSLVSQNIKGGKFSFGENRYYDNEKPIQIIEVKDFNIDTTEVTN